MATQFDDLNARANALFDENHEAGITKVTKHGKFGTSGDYTFELKKENGSGNLDWEVSGTECGYTIKFDHSQTMHNEVALSVKQVPGLALTFNPSFHATTGISLNDVGANWSNDRFHVNLKSGINPAPTINFDMVASNTKCFKGCLGIKGEFDVKSANLNSLGWAWQKSNEDYELAFVNSDYTNPFGMQYSFYKNLKDSKFCCYGVQGSTVDGSLAVAWGQKCCSNLMKYKIDKSGTFSIANQKRLNGAVSMNVSAALNMANMDSGNHNFGIGFTFH